MNSVGWGRRTEEPWKWLKSLNPCPGAALLVGQEGKLALGHKPP